MLLDAVRHFCAQYGLDKTYWIAYSGGLDSHVLLALCQSLRKTLPINFRVIHINHGLHAEANVWAAHCAHVCARYEMDYRECSISVNNQLGDSLEEVAREKRYAVFAELLGASDILLTAHHQDDQAETFLLQLLRGAGLKGLSAMPTIKPFANSLHGRPLLAFPRSALEDYAHIHKLKWIDDESNYNVKLTRNFIRHDILPLLKTRWPTVANLIARSATHCAEAQLLLEEFASAHYQEIRGSHAKTLSIKKLLQLDAAKQRLIVRAWIDEQGYPLPNTKKLTAILQDILHASWDSLPCVHWRGATLRRYRDDLYLMGEFAPHDATQSWTWNFASPLVLPSIGLLRTQRVEAQGLRMDIKNVLVRFRQGGEVLDVPKRGRHTLKNMFQEWNVLPWLRNRIPLIFVDNKLIAVIGYFLNEEYKTNQDEAGLEICFVPAAHRGNI